MTTDDRELRNHLDLDELLRRARSGTLPHVCGGPVNELRRWRAYLVGRAEDLVGKCAAENRTLKPDESRAFGRLTDDAEELRALIVELEAAYRKELADPSNLVEISLRHF
jgi:hypothetical protein